MELLATRQKTISLGKQLVDSLGDEHSADVMSRWMAHYIAEQLTAIETAAEPEKAIAEERCFSAILSLWKHRASLPPGHRPFENFDALFRALEQLDPENPRGFYFGVWPAQEQPKTGPIETLVKFMMNVDRSARILIELALVEATQKAADDETKMMLRDAVSTGVDRDIEAIKNLVELGNRFAPNQTENAKLIKRLRDRLQTLDEFTLASKAVRAALQKELRQLEAAPKTSDATSSSPPPPARV